MDSTLNRYHYWRRGDKEKLSSDFGTQEFTCHCGVCDEQQISIDLIDRLEALRKASGFQIIITSGYRCKAYQAQLRSSGYETSKGPSQHELGNAVDIKRYPNDQGNIKVHAHTLFKAVGTAKTFLHLDIRDDKIRHWEYTSR